MTVREDAIDPFVARFFNERVFGPHRLTYLEGPVDEPVLSDHEATAAAYAKQLDELDAANKNLILSLQQMTSTGDAEIDAQWRSQLQTQFAENSKRKKAVTAELEALAKAIRQPAQVRRDIVAQLPQVSLDVLELPDDQQRQLFDAFQLEIRYDRHRHQVTIKVTIRADMIDSIGNPRPTLPDKTTRSLSRGDHRRIARGGRTSVRPWKNPFPCLTCPRPDTSLNCARSIRGNRLVIAVDLPIP